MLAVLTPGQGSQTPGMLIPWLDMPGAHARLRWFSAVTGLDLVYLGTTATAAEIQDTRVAQPLIVATGLLAAAELPLTEVGITAGHSVGELTAAALAGAISAETAVALAAARGREMAAACDLESTGMSAVLGGDPTEVAQRIDECGLTTANHNSRGQVVVAGTLAQLADLAHNPPTRARVTPLRVAGAFHTPWMSSAEKALAEMGDGITTTNPTRLLLSNMDGSAVTTGPEVISRLVRQVTSPVRWDLCQATLHDLGVKAAIELPPAGVLTGLAKRELPDMTVCPLRTPDDLPAALELIARNTTRHQAQHTPDWRMIVSPAKGTFHPAELTEGSVIRAGTPLGIVRTRRDEHQITANYDGLVIEWLLQEGDLADAGDGLVRLYPHQVGV